MSRMFTARWIAGLSLALSVVGAGGMAYAGPGGIRTAAPLADGAPQQSAREEKSLPFAELAAPAPKQAMGREVRRLITSQEEYLEVVGSPPPADLDFRRYSVVYYSADVRPTGGFEARIAEIRRAQDGRTLTITTQLVSPGAGCMVTQALTYPYTIVRFPRQQDSQITTFQHEDEVRDCTGKPEMAMTP
jgi:hypothetical protein